MDFIFNSFKIKYIILNGLFRKLDLKNIKSVTLYINLESIIGALHSETYEETLKTCTKAEIKNNYLSLISNIINIAAHYRAFFNRMRVQSNIVFFYNEFKTNKILNNIVYNKNYRKHYFDTYTVDKYEYINEIIIDGMEYIQNIIDYLDCIYLLKSDRLESSVIPFVVHSDKKLKSDLNLLLTKDIYDFQYVNHKFLVLYPDKEESIILHKKNLIPYMRYRNNLTEEKYTMEINPLLFPFIYSVLGDKKRSMDKIKGIGFKKLYRSIEKLYDSSFISDEEPSSFNIEHLSSLIKTSNGLCNLQIKEVICSNYYSTDLERQANVVSDAIVEEILSGIVNKFDNNGLKRLNDKIFSDYPIYLEDLYNYTENIFASAIKKANELDTSI